MCILQMSIIIDLSFTKKQLLREKIFGFLWKTGQSFNGGTRLNFAYNICTMT